MTDIGTLLRHGDPVAREPEMAPADVQSVRRAVIGAIATPDLAASRWPGPLLAAAAIAAAIVAGVVVGQRTPAPRLPAIGARSTHVSGAVRAQRQLQFASPGGTRIIWVFDPEFNP